MKKGPIIAAVVVVILLVVGVVAYNQSKQMQQNPSDSTSKAPVRIPGVNDEDLTPPSEPNSINIENYTFVPASITVKKGTTITWTNKDQAEHNVVSDDDSPGGGPNGPLLAKDETYSFTFDTAGTFKYHCQPHPYMKAEVVVTE